MRKFVCLFSLAVFFQYLVIPVTKAAELPMVRLAHAAFNEKVAALWIGVEQGFFRKHGAEVQLLYIRTGPQTIAAMASGEIQMAYTIPSGVLSAAAGGMDLAIFGGIVNKERTDSRFGESGEADSGPGVRQRADGRETASRGNLNSRWEVRQRTHRISQG